MIFPMKARRHRPYGLLRPRELPEGPFDSLSYEFITKLPLTPRGHDSICVCVDRFSKMAFFVLCNEEITAQGFRPAVRESRVGDSRIE
jgi:hypothetical protein